MIGGGDQGAHAFGASATMVNLENSCLSKRHPAEYLVLGSLRPKRYTSEMASIGF